MRTLIAIAAMLLCVSASAAQIPSSVSGIYLGQDRVCRVVLSRFQGSWIKFDLSCIGFDGMPSFAAPVLYAPGECWPDNAAVPFNPQSPTDYLALRGYTTGTMTVLVGTQDGVSNGYGSQQTWTRITVLPSADPFSCAGAPTPQPYYPRLCREFGMYCGN